MTQQVIDIGSAPDDSTGDPLRLSFDKTNENFTELYAKGATEGLWNYNKTSTDTSTAPVSGRFKTNSGDYRGATQIAINAITIQGIDRTSTLRTLLVGDLIQCQDSINTAAWCRYSLQSLPVDHGTWFQLNVTFQADGGVASGDNQEIIFVFTASSGGSVDLSGYAPLASPTFTGDPKAPTPATADNDTSIATTAYVQAQGYLTSAAATVAYQPLDADLTAIAALTGTNTIYYRSAANTWAAVNVSSGLAFSGGNLTATGGAPVGAEYITSTSDATLTAERVLTDTATVTWDRTTAGQIKANAVGGGGGGTTAPQGRLTLQTATPVMTTTQAAKTTIFYTPYQGSLLPIYDGASFSMVAFSELSVLTTDTTKSPAAIGVSKISDWYVWSDAGTLRIGHGPDWTNDTTRSAGTALVMVNGIWLNNASITNGPAALRGTYVGTTRSNASSQLDWIYGGTAVGGLAGFFGVWNCYNRVDVNTTVVDSTQTWTSTGTIRPFDNSPNNRVSAIFGLVEDAATAIAIGSTNTGASGVCVIGVGFNTTSGLTGVYGSIYNNGSSWNSAFGQHVSVPSLGFNFWQMMETSNSTSGAFAGVWATISALSGLQFNARM